MRGRAWVWWLLLLVLVAAGITVLVVRGTTVAMTSDMEPSTCDVEPSNCSAKATVNARKELFITDLSVVEDPARTTGNGAWTFARLVRNMSAGHDASEFVEGWLAHWSNDDLRVNGHPVAARHGIEGLVLNPWRAASGGEKLDVEKAPLRLLAIVNRMDLRAEGNAGEAAFVFNVLDPDGKPTLFNVELEYAVSLDMVRAALRDDPALRALSGNASLSPNQRMQVVAAWAGAWHALGSMGRGESYNAALQRLTDVFSGPNADVTKPNGSALLAVRTNEIALAQADADSGPKHWELREFRLSAATGMLEQVPVARTPDPRFDNTQQLADYINANALLILRDAHRMPASMLAGSAIAPGAFPAPGSDAHQVWMASPSPLAPSIDPDLRFKFAQNTCNGCHLAESGLDQANGTISPTPGVSFLHVRPRNKGAEAMLSTYLTGTTIFDPAHPVITRTLNELERRTADFRAVLEFMKTPGKAVTPSLEAPAPGKVH